MVRKKSVRTRGKLQLSRYFQDLKEGQSVAIVKEDSVNFDFPGRLQGKTGFVKGRRGRSYIVGIMEGKKEKEFIIAPVHLKKIIQTKMETPKTK